MHLDVVKLIYELSKEEHEKHIRDLNTYWVSDLVRCLLKKDYEVKYPELSLRDIFIPYYISGTLIHKGLQSILKEKFGERVETEVEGVKEVLLPDGGKVIVKGRVDAILFSEGVRVGLEIKTSRSDLNIPHEQHLEQVMIYNWLMDLHHSLLIYITLDRVTQFSVLDKFSESEVADIIVNAKYPRYSWECNYCVYAVMCPYKRALGTK
ncbi:MAG: CRISPR-associated protein Cas4 [Sulfolobales archaeon]|nr:CRISPR-associated protein Cas4 [Sulfolobales archaeon]